MTDLDAQIRYLGDLQKLSLNEGDILVIKLPRPEPVETIDRLKNQIEALVPGHKMIFLCEGIEIGVLSKD